MKYIVAAETDIGITKKVNQDSVCVKNAETKQGKAALVMVCDGMGGLSKGELASAEVIRSFSDWFDYELAYELDGDMKRLCQRSTRITATSAAVLCALDYLDKRNKEIKNSVCFDKG